MFIQSYHPLPSGFPRPVKRDIFTGSSGVNRDVGVILVLGVGCGIG